MENELVSRSSFLNDGLSAKSQVNSGIPETSVEMMANYTFSSSGFTGVASS
jgi:hypothetical protein